MYVFRGCEYVRAITGAERSEATIAFRVQRHADGVMDTTGFPNALI